jgi:hypothetical protein
MVTPSRTATQGCPGQIIGANTVTICDGNRITISGSTPSTFGALVIGEETSGILLWCRCKYLDYNVIINE